MTEIVTKRNHSRLINPSTILNKLLIRVFLVMLPSIQISIPNTQVVVPQHLSKNSSQPLFPISTKDFRFFPKKDGHAGLIDGNFLQCEESSVTKILFNF